MYQAQTPPIRLAAIATTERQLLIIERVAASLGIEIDVYHDQHQWIEHRRRPAGGADPIGPSVLLVNLGGLDRHPASKPSSTDDGERTVDLRIDPAVDRAVDSASTDGVSAPRTADGSSDDCLDADAWDESLTQHGVRLPLVVIAGGNTPWVDSLCRLSASPLAVVSSQLNAPELRHALAESLSWFQFQAALVRQHRHHSTILSDLTTRQIQVLEMVMSGLPTKAIAGRLNVSKRLVEVERSQLLKAFDVSGTAEMTAIMGGHKMLDQILGGLDAMTSRQRTDGAATRTVVSTHLVDSTTR